MSFADNARLALLGCPGMQPEMIDKIMADCKMAVDMKDPFGFMEDAQRAGRKYGLRADSFRDFNDPESKLIISMALRNGAIRSKPEGPFLKEILARPKGRDVVTLKDIIDAKKNGHDLHAECMAYDAEQAAARSAAPASAVSMAEFLAYKG